MESITKFLFLMIISMSFCQEDSEYIKIKSELELIEWDLQDECSDMAKNEKNFLLQYPTGLRDKISGEVDHANFLRTHSQRLKIYEDVPYDMLRNWTYYTKCGDILLSPEEYKVLIIFANKNLELKLTDKIKIEKNSSERILNEADVLYELANNRNSTELKEIWKKWELGTSPYKEWYANALDFVPKAAIANEYANVETYWEMLTEMPAGYELSRNLFEAIQPLYKKLLNFVRLRLNKYYNTTYEEYIPIHLTGSFMGDDFSNIAEIILPNPQLYHDIKIELAAREITNFYNYANNCTKNLGFGDLVNANFLQRSNFNEEFDHPNILDYCTEEVSNILTNNHTSLKSYFEAFETVMQMGLTKVNFYARVRQRLRSSSVIESMKSLSSLMSINAMMQNKILEKDAFLNEAKREENRITALFIIALRVLPKIAYYHMMDEFRMEVLEKQEMPEDVFHEKRKIIQGIIAEEEKTTEFLREEDILYNRPYLSKMLGQFLQFQILNYYQIDIFEDMDMSTLFNKDSTFRDFVRNIPNKDPEELFSYYYNIDEVTDYPLLSFFSPLEEYLDNDPSLDQAPFTIKKSKYVKPTTTTTTESPPNKKQKNKGNGKTTPAIRAANPKNAKAKIDNDNLLNSKTNEDSTKIVKENDHDKDQNHNLKDTYQDNTISTAHIGIYIGSSIVLLTLAVIAAGFIMQRRRTHRNQRRYNA